MKYQNAPESPPEALGEGFRRAVDKSPTVSDNAKIRAFSAVLSVSEIVEVGLLPWKIPEKGKMNNFFKLKIGIGLHIEASLWIHQPRAR